MLFRPEIPRPHLAAILLTAFAIRLSDVRILLDEPRPQIVEQPEHVVRHQHLPVAPGPGADADSRNLAPPP